MIDHNTMNRQAWLKSLQPKNIGWDILATALGATAILLSLFI
jgi:hypothetical protein